MCDQTEVPYLPGNVVWVKLGPVWWPGVVANSEEVPPEITKNLRKPPIAIVKFFQEEEFEYVNKLSNIYHYNCLKKNDFIRKGLDLYRAKNRDTPSNMKFFPGDVASAEVLTGGNPNILHDEMFQPEEKPIYADLFANTKKSPKKIKLETKKRISSTPSQSTPRIITHPRFIKLSSGIETDYEVRERKQEPIRAECDEEDNSPPTTYRCQDCDFTTIRLNVIVLHNKSHTRKYNTPTPTKATKRKNISVVRVKEQPSAEWTLQYTEPVKTKIAKTNGTISKTGKRGRPRKIVESKTPPSVTKIKEPESKRSSDTPTAKPKRNAPQKDEFQKLLLEDWAEFEMEQDSSENEDTSFETSVTDIHDTKHKKSAKETKTNDEKHANKTDDASKSCFDFDDSEEQLVIDKSKIRAGRKIPRVLDDKSEEVTSNESDDTKQGQLSEMQEKNEEMEVDTQVEEKINKTEVEKQFEKKHKKMEINNKIEENNKDMKAVTEIKIGTEEISVELTTDDISPAIDKDSKSPEKKVNNDAQAEEAIELSQKVDQLLKEVSAPSKLPVLPRSLKKEHIKSYNASITQKSNDDIIESISLINDDSSDGFENKSNTENGQMSVEIREENHSDQRNEMQTTLVDCIENIEVTSDSSPEIVSVEMPPKISGIVKKTITTAATPASLRRNPIKFTTTARLKTINSTKMIKALPFQTDRPGNQKQVSLASKTRPVLSSLRAADGRKVIQLSTTGQQAASQAGKVMVKNLPKSVMVQRPIANIDLTGSKIKFMPPTSQKVRVPSNVLQKSFKSVVGVNKVQPKSVVLRPETVQMLVQTPLNKPASSAEVVLNADSGMTPMQSQSEIITMPEEIMYMENNEQTEYNYIVDEAGNLIAESTSKKEDILAKALQDTDVLQTEMVLSNSSAIVLDSCNVTQNTSTPTIYENVTLNTPPIMSSFETPSRTVSANTMAEIPNEMIIISDGNVEYIE